MNLRNLQTYSMTKDFFDRFSQSDRRKKMEKGKKYHLMIPQVNLKTSRNYSPILVLGFLFIVK